MNQFNKGNFTTCTTYTLKSGYGDTRMTFEVQDGTNLVRMRHYCKTNDPNIMYIRHFNVHSPYWSESRKIDSETWYDIQVARDVWNYLTGQTETDNESYGYKPFTRVL